MLYLLTSPRAFYISLNASQVCSYISTTFLIFQCEGFRSSTTSQTKSLIGRIKKTKTDVTHCSSVLVYVAENV